MYAQFLFLKFQFHFQAVHFPQLLLKESQIKFPTKFVALPFEVYLSGYIRTKQEEIESLREARNKFREILYKLQPLALKHEDKIQIFEPSYRRELPSSLLKNWHA